MARLTVEVVYARHGRQDVVTVELDEGADVLDALHASGLCERYAELDPLSAKLGVYGKEVSRHTPLADGDRVEIYRPLAAEPRDARRARALRATRR